MNTSDTMPSSDNRRLVLKGLTLSIASAFGTAACGGGGGPAGTDAGTSGGGGGGASGSGSSSGGGSSSGSGSSSGGGTISAVTPSLFPSNGTAQFFAASSAGTTNAPFCIGQAFRPGEIPSGSSIVANITEFQATVKNRWPDGSVKFAIVAGRLSVNAGASKAVVLSKGAAATGAAVSEADLIAANPDISVQFGSAAAVRLRDLLGVASTYNSSTKVWSSGRVKQWVSGPQMSSWLYRAHVGASPHLVVWFEVRMWKGGPVQVLPWLENGYLKVANPTEQTGAAMVLVSGAPRFVWNFTGSNKLPHHCRAPLVGTDCQPYWLGSTRPDLSISHDTIYLQQTRLVPTYFATTPTSSTRLATLSRNYTPQGRLDYADAMSGTGYAPAIGLIPEWDALYLTSRGDVRAQQAVLAHGLAAGRFGIHYRDEATGEPIRLSQYPNLVVNETHSAITGVGHSTTNDYTPAPLNGGAAEWDTPHHPSIGYMAYLLTGSHYFLEELQFSAGINFLHHHSAYRLGAKGVFETGHMPTRGTAWAWRTLAQAACVTPDDHVLRGEYIASMDENMAYYHNRYVLNPANPLGVCLPYSDYTTNNNGVDNDGVYMHATWMEDFLTATTGYVYTLEVSGSTALRTKHRDFFEWKAKAIVGRLAAIDDNTGWPLVDAARYYIAVAPANANWTTGLGPWYGNWRDAYNAHLAATGSTDPMKQAPANTLRGGYYPDATSYWGNMLPAIAYAVDLGAAGADAAYARLTSASNWLDILAGSNNAPVWSIRPINGSRGAPYVYPSKLDESAMPAWRSGQALNTWREIPGTSMSSLPPPLTALRALSYSGPNSKIDAWNSLALDNRDATLYSAANGGHMDYAGNEVDSIRLLDNAPRWVERLSSSASDKVVIDTTYYADGTPSSRHSYYSHIFVEQRNRAMHVYNGVPFGNGRGGSWVVDGFDPSTNRWDPRDSYAKANIGELTLGSPVTLDPSTGDAYVFPNDGYSVWRWNQESNAWSQLLNNVPNFHSYYAASAFDSKRRRILLLGGNIAQTRAKDKGMLYDVGSNTMIEVTFTGSAAAALTAMPGLLGSIGLTYVPELDAYAVGGDTTPLGGATVFLIDAANFTVSGLNTGLSGTLIPSCQSNIFNRFLYVPKLGGIVYYPIFSSNIWFLRLV